VPFSARKTKRLDLEERKDRPFRVEKRQQDKEGGTKNGKWIFTTTRQGRKKKSSPWAKGKTLGEKRRTPGKGERGWGTSGKGRSRCNIRLDRAPYTKKKVGGETSKPRQR